MIDLPTIADPALFIVLMSSVFALGLSRLVGHWADGHLSRLGLLLFLIAGGGFGWIALQEGFTIATIPEAFLEIVARLIR